MASSLREEEPRPYLSSKPETHGEAWRGVTRAFLPSRTATLPSQEATRRDLGDTKALEAWPLHPCTQDLAGGTDHVCVAAVPGTDSHSATCPTGQINSYTVTPTARGCRGDGEEGMRRKGAAGVGRGGSWHAFPRRG